MILCSQGHENPDGATYCPVCQTYIDQVAAEPPEPEPEPTSVAPEPVVPASPPEVSLTSDRVRVLPGSEAATEILVRNTGAEPGEYIIEVDGDPALGPLVDPWSLSVAPGALGTARILFRPAGSLGALGGIHIFQVKVVSTPNPELPAYVQGTVELLTLRPLSADLDPETSKGRALGTHRIVVRNHGGASVGAALGVVAADSNVRFEIDPPHVATAPNAEASATLHVRPPRSWLLPRTHRFNASVEPEGYEAFGVDGAMVQRPEFLGWLGGGVTAAIIALASLLAIVGGGDGGGMDRRELAAACRTGIYEAGEADRATGICVGLIQELLTEKGFYAGAITETFDAATQASVVQFQQSHGGLNPDGEVGPRTWAALLENT